MKQAVCVLGEGAWGTAIATLLAYNGYSVRLWCYNQGVAEDIARSRINTLFLPQVILSDRIIPTADIAYAMSDIEFVFQAIPVMYLRSVLMQAMPFYTNNQTWVSLSKGLEESTLFLATDIIDDVFGCIVKKVALSGPSFAHGVSRKEITAVAIAGVDCEVALIVQAMLANPYFRPYVNTDTHGVQWCGALKNVLSLGIGLLDGSGYTDNAKAFLFTRGLNEIADLVVAAGGQRETVYGLAGVGDAVLTAMGGHSKNVAFGKKLAVEYSARNVIKNSNNLPEGVITAKSVCRLEERFGIELPVLRSIYQVLYEESSVESIMHQLVSHKLSWECARQ